MHMNALTKISSSALHHPPHSTLQANLKPFLLSHVSLPPLLQICLPSSPSQFPLSHELALLHFPSSLAFAFFASLHHHFDSFAINEMPPHSAAIPILTPHSLPQATATFLSLFALFIMLPGTFLWRVGYALAFYFEQKLYEINAVMSIQVND